MTPVAVFDYRGTCFTSSMLARALSLEAFEYSLWLHGPYASGFKGLEDRLCRKGRLPGTLEQWKEVSLRDWDEPLAPLEVAGELLGVAT